ncbi:hypothetical protein J3R83DRAFT_10954 [Lanmaoa asiatica]|nr:hypothetical protein J3R83DRAFT_10954 [Lanmaoa asiatica]
MSKTPVEQCPTPLTSEPGVRLAYQTNKSTQLSPLLSPSAGKKALYVGKLDPSKYRKLEGAADYTKALQDTIKFLQLPLTSHPSPDVLRMEFMNALLKRNAMAAALADAEQIYEDRESALRQILGEKEVQTISRAHVAVSVDDADTVKGQYITAITRIRMRDFCLSRMV